MFKKHIFLTIILAITVGTMSAAFAAQNAVTPSTNDINRTNSWAHVDQLSMGPGTTDLQFISTRAFYSCFEYRTDGDTSQRIAANGGNNYNTLVTDGLYPYYCQSNSSSIHTISANAYVEVRMVFGAETDERFDWTRFDVVPVTPFSCVGFQSPVATGTTIKVKKNRVIPFKAELLDGVTPVIGTDLSAPPVIQVMFDSGGGSAIDVTESALSAGLGTEGNQFVFSNGVWQFNLQTKNYTAKGTYTVTMDSGNGGVYIVNPTCTGQFVIE
jgi:hypothetical protein